ncbi:MAG: class I SAM-dependent methyltransferase [Rhodoferax sp.]|nr:class I SAM-dependent methyltransferase [Rhodoferax sp.]
MGTESLSLPNTLLAQLQADLVARGGWMGFDHFMAQALYAPGLGYYAASSRQFGPLARDGSDFVTAPEISPLFGQCLATQVAQALEHTGCDTVWEFGAGTGVLARDLLQALQTRGQAIRRYVIVELSAALRQRQQQTLAGCGVPIEWADGWPATLEGVVVGNEVLDAMPVQLLLRRQGQWYERGVSAGPAGGPPLCWADRPTGLCPPLEVPGEHDYLTEIHPQAEAFVQSLAERLTRGAVLLIDYGFPEREYYHPQRHMGTLMCHQGHRADGDPLSDVGRKDITAHVNFTGIAVAAQQAGLELLGYCSQARFLFNCGLGPLLDAAPLSQRANAQRLVLEHEMGELFKVMGLCRGEPWPALGFAAGDRSASL